jgi:hypothetical protein
MCGRLAVTTREVQVSRGEADAGETPLAADALHVATVAAEVGGSEAQVIPFGLTASMARHGAGAHDVVEAILALRRAVVSAAGLDPATEPVPLVVGDPAVAAVSLARYLQGLLDRAARAMRTDAAGVSSATLALLRAG